MSESVSIYYLDDLLRQSLRKAFTDYDARIVFNHLLTDFRDLLKHYQKAHLVREGDTFKTLGDYAKKCANNSANVNMTLQESCREEMGLVAVDIWSTRVRFEKGDEAHPWQVPATRAALALRHMRSWLAGVRDADYARSSAGADARRAAASLRREQALEMARELKAANPHLSKDDIAHKLVERGVYRAFATARDALREPKPRPIDEFPGDDDDLPRVNDEKL